MHVVAPQFMSNIPEAAARSLMREFGTNPGTSFQQVAEIIRADVNKRLHHATMATKALMSLLKKPMVEQVYSYLHRRGKEKGSDRMRGDIQG